MASTVQSRISEFESMRYTKYSPPSLLETPLSPTASSFKAMAPQESPSASHGSPSGSSSGMDRKPSLIDLRDWVVDDGPSVELDDHSGGKTKGNLYTPTPTQKGFGNGLNRSNSAPLINLDSPPKLKATRNNNKQTLESNKPPPPLPPRKPSFVSLKDAASSSSKRSDSLTVEPPHTYPPKLSLTTNTSSLSNGSASGGSLRTGLGHAPASSISSFHSVSLSSDGGTDYDPSTPGSISSAHIANYPVERVEFHSTALGGDTSSRPVTLINGREADAVSLDESFENVSSSSIGSPATNAIITMDWERALSKNKFPYTPRTPVPPKLPQRPASSTSKSSGSKASPSMPYHSSSAPMSPKIQPMSSASSSHSSDSVSSSFTVIPSAVRRKPPPPPPSSYPSPPVSQPSSPPILPTRPASSRISLTSNSASDRSSIFSVSTNTSRSSFVVMQSAESQPGSKLHLPLFNGQTSSPKVQAAVLRPTPVPAAARQRYEAVFKSNLEQVKRAERAERDARRAGKRKGSKPLATNPETARRSRQAAGWRGLSVDLITGIVDEPTDEEDDKPLSAVRARKLKQERISEVEDDEWEDLARSDREDRLEGCVVRLIWSKSRLDRDRLRGIWLECDPTGSGSLTQDAFIRGMWRIDEELRRARIRSSTSSAASSSSWKERKGYDGSGDMLGNDVARRIPSSLASKPKTILR
ncbi:hypothetical protein CCMSSC00406_0005769 [Pleurotus cornucopiae]|uniref:Uncharacterized protein n=1 Tax=Pleurotus cornucopiae TaxID=5321 RepID=A0ACB7J934_PLECO|nr:hypothetical protein CCMSSC00406_0005769 [Pleurotus cornucopiae]